jgi:hypothetical protein
MIDGNIGNNENSNENALIQIQIFLKRLIKSNTLVKNVFTEGQ